METPLANQYLSLITNMLSTAFHVNAACAIPDAACLEKLDHGILKVIYHNFDYANYLQIPVLKNPRKNHIYFLQTALERTCVIFKLPETPENRLFIIGPFLYEEPSVAFYERVLTKNRIPSSASGILRTYFSTVPVVNEMSMLSTAHIIASYLFTDYRPEEISYLNLDTPDSFTDEPSSMLNFSMQLLEERYRAENLLLNAITRGDLPQALQYLYNFSTTKLPPRVYDPIRDLKNTLIIINTLYRKAAEKGNVHAIYLDEISTKFSLEIEHTNNIEQLNNLPIKMTRKYCLLVNNYSLASYSRTVRKVINHISLNLNSSLSLQTLADIFSLNSSYLSAQFKKEAGITLTEYIHSKRIEAAVRLLNSTTLPIREVAYRVGIDDFSYFTKLFKKYIHMPPLQYRNMLHKRNEDDSKN